MAKISRTSSVLLLRNDFPLSDNLYFELQHILFDTGLTSPDFIATDYLFVFLVEIIALDSFLYPPIFKGVTM